MTSSMLREEGPPLGQGGDDEMVRYGITRAPTDYFYYKGYRYTRLEDAIAQAKRQRSAAPPGGREQAGSR